MPVDNFDRVAQLLPASEEPDKFYFLQLIRRRKENPTLPVNSTVLLSKCITSGTDLLERKDTIVSICDAMQARACIRLNRRSYRKVAFDTALKLLDHVKSGSVAASKHAFESIAGQLSDADSKLWVLDVDGAVIEDDYVVDFLTASIARQRPDPQQDKVVALIPSKTGFHIISKPFDVKSFETFTTLLATQCRGVEVTVHKDNPTNVYIP